ncbi:MAG: hypothetical protein AMQ74_01893 [Candidatus Methanofastidiosum methylothiophilum]|uniref:Uncharacterized protein n=1 Tax=Candidatus Methanofastidiosum methylothiophilum TaxID=1705564 RepID=A0A150IKW0_9EURY|nr:MAG: hypothetical protein AMQ74_01893 [Candidatus Methanofastidiosum methylthiophilus]
MKISIVNKEKMLREYGHGDKGKDYSVDSHEAKNMDTMRKDLPKMIREVEHFTGMKFKKKPELIFSHPAPYINNKYYYACSVDGREIAVHSRMAKNKGVLEDYIKHELVENIYQQNKKEGGHKKAKQIEKDRKKATKYAEETYPNTIFYDNQIERAINTIKLVFKRGLKW